MVGGARAVGSSAEISALTVVLNIAGAHYFELPATGWLSASGGAGQARRS